MGRRTILGGAFALPEVSSFDTCSRFHLSLAMVESVDGRRLAFSPATQYDRLDARHTLRGLTIT